MYDPLIIFLYNFKTIFGENYLIVHIYQVFRLGHCDSEQNCFVSHKRRRTRHLVYVSMTIIFAIDDRQEVVIEMDNAR